MIVLPCSTDEEMREEYHYSKSCGCCIGGYSSLLLSDGNLYHLQVEGFHGFRLCWSGSSGSIPGTWEFPTRRDSAMDSID